MDWLYDNPVSRMGAPVLLPLYWGALAVAILVIRSTRARMRGDQVSTPLQIPQRVNPYQMAFLRGGDSEVVRTAVLDLVERGRLIEVPPEASGSQAKAQPIRWQAASPLDDAADVPPLQRAVLQAFRTPAEATAVFGADLSPVLREHTRRFREWMEEERLGENREHRPRFRNLVVGLLLGLFAM